MRIDYEWLRTFVDAGSARTFASAATDRGVSPSAISQQIKALERELGVPLFERFGRRVKLTPEGTALLAELRSAIARIDAALDTTAERHGRVEGWVAIGAPRTFGRYWLRPRLAPLLATHPGLRLRVVFGVPSVLERQLVDGELDLVLLVRPPELPGLETEPLAGERFVAVAAPGRFVGSGRTRDDFAVQRWIRFDRDEAMHGPWWRASFGRDAAPAVDVVCEVASLDEMLALVEAGVGMAVLPDYQLTDALAAGRVVVVEPDPCLRQARGTILLAWRAGAIPTARLTAVREGLRATGGR